MSTRIFVSKWVPVLAWMILIFAGSTDVLSADHTSRLLVPFLRWLDPQISFAMIAHINIVLRKLGHLAEYAILAALLWRALHVTLKSTATLLIGAIALITSALFAISDEIHQSFVPSRTPSQHDVLIDICGAIIGLAICWLLMRRHATEEL
jgi:VanZ family protein